MNKHYKLQMQFNQEEEIGVVEEEEEEEEEEDEAGLFLTNP
jgi:hypothetical protein